MKHQRRKMVVGAVVIAMAGFSTAGQILAQMEGPDSVVLDTLAMHYEAVQFDHALHVDLADGNCAECHHHTVGTKPVDPQCIKCHANSGEADMVACRDCHSEKRFEAAYLQDLENNAQSFHKDKPGLKGAYHQNCLGCHENMGAPVGCQDCHPRNDAGDAFFHSGSHAPKAPKNEGGHE